MEPLKATKAREITKESVTEAETLFVNGVPVSKAPEHPMQAGDFYFRLTPTQSVAKTPLWRRILLRETRNRIVYGSTTTIIISCPVCGLPILTSPAHKIIQRKPLTIEGQVACPYAPTVLAGAHAFSIKEGNIMAA